MLASHGVRLPAPALRPFVSHHAGFRAHGVPPGTHAGLPSRHAHLIISLAEPIEVLQMPNSTQHPDRFEDLGDRTAGCACHSPSRTREWKALAGCSPKAWLADELPFLQDYELAGGEDSEP